MAEIKPVNYRKEKRSFWDKYPLRYKFIFVLLLVLLFGFFGWAKSSAPSALIDVFGPKTSLETENDRVNILLLGMAGGKHDGATLTDTIMVASYDLNTNTTVLISIPRDLWIEKHKVKVNALYQTGLKNDNGLGFARGEIGDLLGVTIPYAVRIDFSGFVKAVDLVEGIDVTITNSFDDYSYPVEGKEKELCGFIEEERELSEEEASVLSVPSGRQKVLLSSDGKIATASSELTKGITYSDQQIFDLFRCRFEHLTFKEGLTQMDGITALKFVRSRHGTNQEGTDFARSRRQQLVLQAFKDNILSTETLLDPSKVVSLVQTFGESFETDVPQTKYLELLKLMKKMKEVKSFVIDSSGKDPLLIAPPSGIYGAWVLIPPKNDFSRIQKYVSDIFTGILDSSSSAQLNR